MLVDAALLWLGASTSVNMDTYRYDEQLVNGRFQMPPTTLATLTTTPQRVSTCGGGLSSPVDLAEASRRANLLKAFADPVRLQLLSIIAAAPGQEACVCDMTELVDVSQSTVSHHLKLLVDAGILERERRGSWAWFRLTTFGAPPAASSQSDLGPVITWALS